jgi:hypothetical protein
MILVEDYDYWLRFGLVSKIFHIPESLYLYRMHEQMLTKTHKIKIREKKLQLKQKYLQYYHISPNAKPILDLYIWFIEEKTIFSFLHLLKITLKNPIIILKYIYKNYRRFGR